MLAVAMLVTATACDRASELQGTDSAAPVTVAVDRVEDRPLRALFVGDSLNAGLFASSESNGFRLRMVRHWSDDGPVEAVKAEKVHGTTGEVTSLNRSMTSKGMDLIVVELGTNDGGGTTPLGQFEREYGALVENLRRDAPDAGIICAGTWRSRSAGAEYDDVIKRICSRSGGAFRPLVDLFERAELRGPAGRQAYGGLSDDFHPNDEGHAEIAERLLAAVEVR